MKDSSPPCRCGFVLSLGVGFFFSSFLPGQIQPYTSGVRLSTGYHQALTPAAVEHLGIVREVAALIVHFVNVGGARCAR